MTRIAAGGLIPCLLIALGLLGPVAASAAEAMTSAGGAKDIAGLLAAAEEWAGQLGELAPIAEGAIASAEGWDARAFSCLDLLASGLYLDNVELTRSLREGDSAWLVSIAFSLVRAKRGASEQTIESLVLGVSSGERFVEFNSSFVDGIPKRLLIVRREGDELVFKRLSLSSLRPEAETRRPIPDPRAPISLRSYSTQLADFPADRDRLDMTSYDPERGEVLTDRFFLDRPKGIMTVVMGRPGKESTQEVRFGPGGREESVSEKRLGLTLRAEDAAEMLPARERRMAGVDLKTARIETVFDNALSRLAMPAAVSWTATIEPRARSVPLRRLQAFADPRAWEFRHGTVVFKSGPGLPRYRSVSARQLEEWTKPSSLIESDAPEIAAAAREAAGGRGGARERALAVTAWVYKRLSYDTGVIEGDALQTLRTGRGDCTEFSVLIVAMLRSLGIPATVVTGFCYDPPSGSFVGHAWVLARVGPSWLELEGTTGSPVAGSAYLPFPLRDNLGPVRRITITGIR